jgi:hypothetical protein
MWDRGGNLSDPDGRRFRGRTLVVEDDRLRRCSKISRSGEAKKAMRELGLLLAQMISGTEKDGVERNGDSQRTAKR